MVTLALLCGLAAETGTRPKPEQADQYHRDVKALSESMPMQIGDWIGESRETTTSALKLLRPNFIISQMYTNVETGQIVGFLLVHCKDARDIAGHYPPNCYPSQGMRELGRREMNWLVNDVPITGVEYEFAPDSLNESSSVAVENFIVTPGAYVRDMDAVRQQAGDFTKRFFGAAQVQVIFYNPGQEPEDVRRETFNTIIGAYLPLIELIRNGAKS